MIEEHCLQAPETLGNSGIACYRDVDRSNRPDPGQTDRQTNHQQVAHCIIFVDLCVIAAIMQPRKVVVCHGCGHSSPSLRPALLGKRKGQAMFLLELAAAAGLHSLFSFT